jgi:hypothetical protein
MIGKADAKSGNGCATIQTKWQALTLPLCY